MIRSIQVSGILAGDPEMRKAGQKEIASGRLAVSQGRDKPTIWFDLTAWGQYQGEALMRCQKGTRLVVAGRLNLRQWTDRNGQTRDNLGIDIDSIEAPRATDGEQFDKRVATVAARYDDGDIPF